MAVTDALDRLTIGELDAGSRLLKTDIVTAVAEHTMHKWAGLAIVAYLIDRRTDPTVQLATYRAMTPVELAGTLGLNDDDPEEATADDEDPAAAPAPTTPAPVQTPPAPAPPMTKAEAAQLAADTEKAIRQAVTVDPTAPSPVPSSPGRGGPTR